MLSTFLCKTLFSISRDYLVSVEIVIECSLLSSRGSVHRDISLIIYFKIAVHFTNRLLCVSISAAPYEVGYTVNLLISRYYIHIPSKVVLNPSVSCSLSRIHSRASITKTCSSRFDRLHQSLSCHDNVEQSIMLQRSIFKE